MGFEHILVERSGDFVTITMNRPERRNALSRAHIAGADGRLRRARSQRPGIVLAGNGPVSPPDTTSATSWRRPGDGALDAGDLRRADALMQPAPQPVVARVHGLATAAGCQLVANADLAVAARPGGFAAPGGKGGWFCHTPMVAIGRNVGRKRAMELALSGDVIDA